MVNFGCFADPVRRCALPAGSEGRALPEMCVKPAQAWAVHLPAVAVQQTDRLVNGFVKLHPGQPKTGALADPYHKTSLNSTTAVLINGEVLGKHLFRKSEMFDPQRKYKIHWEITDLCNLKCPMCPRTDAQNRCRPTADVRNTQFFLDDVKELLPDTFLKQVQRIDFCGNFGDPCMARDFTEICRHLMTCGAVVMVSTNGAMRRPQWWENLGRVFADSHSWVEFHLDGLADTNHFYRIGARWENIEANAAAFIAAGGRAEWHFILFKHNQHQVETARAVARWMGFRAFVPTTTGRFPHGGRFAYMHPDGDWRSLEQATVSLEENPEKQKAGADPSARCTTAAGSDAILCKSAEKNRFFIDATGYMAPCCWVSNRDPRRPGDMLRAVAAAGKDPERFNLRRRPIEDILGDDLFSQTFPQLWGASALVTCQKKCGRRHRNVKIREKL
jgi:MoaA/NifB/PqqE/SkfB family radical SAM enzyme